MPHYSEPLIRHSIFPHYHENSLAFQIFEVFYSLFNVYRVSLKSFTENHVKYQNGICVSIVCVSIVLTWVWSDRLLSAGEQSVPWECFSPLIASCCEDCLFDQRFPAFLSPELTRAAPLHSKPIFCIHFMVVLLSKLGFQG